MYHYIEKLHNITSSTIILNYVFKMINVNSAIDVGCGLGNWIESLYNFGIKEINAIDAEWFNINIIQNYIPKENFICHNFENGIYKTDKKFDLAICLEVVEHIKQENELNIIETLVGLSDIILFSAAVPKQGGDNHVNEQWPLYWQKLFKQYNYEFMDIIRPYIWKNQNIHKWYRQNIFLVVKKEIVQDILKKYNELHIENQMIDVIHPEYWNKKVKL